MSYPQTCLLPILTVPAGGQVQLIRQQDLPNGFGFQSAFAVPHQFASDQTLEDLNTEDKVYFLMAWLSRPLYVCALPASWPHALCAVEGGSSQSCFLTINWETSLMDPILEILIQ